MNAKIDIVFFKKVNGYRSCCIRCKRPYKVGVRNVYFSEFALYCSSLFICISDTTKSCALQFFLKYPVHRQFQIPVCKRTSPVSGSVKLRKFLFEFTCARVPVPYPGTKFKDEGIQFRPINFPGANKSTLQLDDPLI